MARQYENIEMTGATQRDSVAYEMVADYTSVGKTVVLPLRGFSMRPFLEDNRDKALLAKVPRTLRRGDVIMARLARHGSFALHRITRVEGDMIEMCGDGNITPEVVRRQDVIAIALGFYRKGSRKLDSVDALSYRLYWHLWLMLKPLRRWLLLVWKTYRYPRQMFATLQDRIKRKKT